MISTSAQYAIRALAYMAAESEERDWFLNREIARVVDLPPQYLAKILRVLASAGILESQRGKTGGFRLARSAGRISLLQIVQAFDTFGTKRVCLLGQSRCSDTSACILHWEWSELRDALVDSLRKRTLGEAVAQARGAKAAEQAPGGKVAQQARGKVAAAGRRTR
ncbi:MAG: Rrf2 family transcriptional regulator [Candidatus Eisenbacteria bacterium]